LALRALSDVQERLLRAGFRHPDPPPFPSQILVSREFEETFETIISTGVDNFILSKYIPQRKSFLAYFAGLSPLKRRQIAEILRPITLNLTIKPSQECRKIMEQIFLDEKEYSSLLDTMCFITAERKTGRSISKILANPKHVTEHPELAPKLWPYVKALSYVDSNRKFKNRRERNDELSSDLVSIVQVTSHYFLEVIKDWSARPLSEAEAQTRSFLKLLPTGGPQEKCLVCPTLEDTEAAVEFVIEVPDREGLVEKAKKAEPTSGQAHEAFLRLSRDPVIGPLLVRSPLHKPFLLHLSKSTKGYVSLAISLAHYFSHSLIPSLIEDGIENFILQALLGEKIPTQSVPSQQQLEKRAMEILKAPPPSPFIQLVRCLANLLSVKRDTAERIVQREPACLLLLKTLLVTLDKTRDKLSAALDQSVSMCFRDGDIVEMAWQLSRCFSALARFKNLQPILLREKVNDALFGFHVSVHFHIRDMALQALSLITQKTCAHEKDIFVKDIDMRPAKKLPDEPSKPNQPEVKKEAPTSEPDDAMKGALEQQDQLGQIDFSKLESSLSDSQVFAKPGQRLISCTSVDGLIFIFGVEKKAGLYHVASACCNLATEQIRDAIFQECHSLDQANIFLLSLGPIARYWSPISKVSHSSKN